MSIRRHNVRFTTANLAMQGYAAAASDASMTAASEIRAPGVTSQIGTDLRRKPVLGVPVAD